MKTLIIEDEFRNYNRLRKMLMAYEPTMTIEGPLESVAETKQWLAVHKKENAPDLILADIRLGDGLSFDALHDIDGASALVFTTAYDEYALQAFRNNGLAYLMKPIEEDELRQTIDRIKAIKADGKQRADSELRQLLQQMRASEYKYRERFLVPYKDGFEVINVNDIAYICTEYKDTRIRLSDNKKGCYSISISLDEIERQLNPNSFFRVNRQYIVNVSSVKGLKTFFGGKLRVCLLGYDEVEIMCSRDKATALKEWLNK